jgi:hypothetical protein
MQRYDYLVRTRKATDEELEDLRNTPSSNYPQRDAVVWTLRHLSGQDLGKSTDAWKKYVSELTTDKSPPEKKDPPKEAEKPTPKDTPPKDRSQ